MYQHWTLVTLGFLVTISLLGSGNATSASAIVGCLNYQFMNNGSCHPCPTNCKACASRTNCTVCQKGFFGTVCEHKCDANCTGTCHKQYGHCTYGCPDGTYPADDNSCQPCLDHCLLCETLPKCVLYEEEACRLSCHGNCTNCDRATGQCTPCHISSSQHDVQASGNDVNDNSSNNHVTTLPVIVSVLVVVVVAGVIAVLLFYLKRYSTNASIKREPMLKVASSSDVVQMDLASQTMFKADNATVNIHGSEGSKLERKVDGRDVNKTVDIIPDIDPGIKVKTGKDTDPESDISDLDYDIKHEINPSETQYICSAQNGSMFSMTTPSPFKHHTRHRTRASNPYQKPKYKDKSGKVHTQCRTLDTICNQEYTPILPEEQCEVKCSEVFGKAYYDQVERFTS